MYTANRGNIVSIIAIPAIDFVIDNGGHFLDDFGQGSTTLWLMHEVQAQLGTELEPVYDWLHHGSPRAIWNRHQSL
jgi:hypothetical protein